MATVIDSLVVALGLDSKELDAKAPSAGKKLADLEKAADKTESGVKGIGTASKGTASELSNLSTKLGSFLAIIGGTVAIRAFVKDTVDANTQLYFLSQNLAMTAQSLFTLGAAGQRIGIGKNALQGLAASFREIPGQLAAGQQPPVIKLLARAGVNWLGSPDEMMAGLAKWFQAMPKNVALGLGTSYGLSYDQMTFLLQGADKVTAQLKETKMWSPTGKQTAQAVELKKQFTDIGLQFAKIGYDLLEMVTPALEKFLSFLQSIGAWAQQHEGIVAIVSGLAMALGTLAGLAGAVGALSLALTGLWAGIVAALPVLAEVGIIAALAGAIMLLWNDYKVWSEGGKSLFDWTAWMNAIKGAKGIWDDLGNALKTAKIAWDDVGNSIKTATDKLAGWIAKVAISLGVDPSMTTLEGQAAAEKKSIAAYNAAHPGNTYAPAKTTTITPGMYALGNRIAKEEGFFDSRSGNEPNASGKGSHFSSTAKSNIPQASNNPGDIEYGPFAKDHGATGYVLAKGGKKIATFADGKAGWMALYALLGTKGYAGLSPDQAISRWQTGSAVINGVSGASNVPASVASSANTTSSSTDNSKTTHIGTVNIQGGGNTLPSTPSMARGMDWTTLLTQNNFGLQ